MARASRSPSSIRSGPWRRTAATRVSSRRGRQARRHACRARSRVGARRSSSRLRRRSRFRLRPVRRRGRWRTAPPDDRAGRRSASFVDARWATRVRPARPRAVGADDDQRRRQRSGRAATGRCRDRHLRRRAVPRGLPGRHPRRLRLEPAGRARRRRRVGPYARGPDGPAGRPRLPGRRAAERGPALACDRDARARVAPGLGPGRDPARVCHEHRRRRRRVGVGGAVGRGAGGASCTAAVGRWRADPRVAVALAAGMVTGWSRAAPGGPACRVAVLQRQPCAPARRAAAAVRARMPASPSGRFRRRCLRTRAPWA